MKHRIFGSRRRRAALITAISILLGFYTAPTPTFADTSVCTDTTNYSVPTIFY